MNTADRRRLRMGLAPALGSPDRGDSEPSRAKRSTVYDPCATALDDRRGRRDSALGFSRFTRRYLGNPGWFLFLRLAICLSSAGNRVRVEGSVNKKKETLQMRRLLLLANYRRAHHRCRSARTLARKRYSHRANAERRDGGGCGGSDGGRRSLGEERRGRRRGRDEGTRRVVPPPTTTAIPYSTASALRRAPSLLRNSASQR